MFNFWWSVLKIYRQGLFSARIPRNDNASVNFPWQEIKLYSCFKGNAAKKAKKIATP